MGTVIGNLLRAIFADFKANYPQWIKKTYKKINPKIKDEVSLFIAIADNVNDVIQSKSVDFVTSLIPGNLDDNLVYWLRLALPRLIDTAKEYTGIEKAMLVGQLTAERLDTTLDQALITSQVVYRESRPA